MCGAGTAGPGDQAGGAGGVGRGCREQVSTLLSALQPGIGFYSFSFLNVGSGLFNFNSENRVATWLSNIVPFHSLRWNPLLKEIGWETFFIPAAQPRPGEHRTPAWPRVQSGVSAWAKGPACLPCQSPVPVKASPSSPCSSREASSPQGADPPRPGEAPSWWAPFGNDRGHRHFRFPRGVFPKSMSPPLPMQRVARRPAPVGRAPCRECACGGPSPAEGLQVHRAVTEA